MPSAEPSAESSSADRIAEELARAGCKVAFGVPGGEVLTLIAALEAHGIEVVLSRQESAAAHLAQGVARGTGGRVPGVLVTTVGPGVAMAVDGIASAHQDRVPLIALTGCVDDEDIAAGFTHQVFDQRALLAPVVKGARHVQADTAAQSARWAIDLALTPRHGPVQLEVSPGIAARPSPNFAEDERAQPAASPSLAAMARGLFEAERLLIVLGLDALERGASEALAGLLAALDAPVITTYLAKGVFDENEPQALGAFGLSPAVDRALLPVAAQADVVLLVGYDPIEVRSSWTAPFAGEAKLYVLAHVERDPRLAKVSEQAIGPLTPSIEALSAELRELGTPERDARWIEAARLGLAHAHIRMDASAPGQLIAALAAAAPRDAQLAIDTGAHRILLSQRWRTHAPGTLVQSTGLCTMACAVPLAMGLKVAQPHRPVIAVTGDGGLEMVLGELATVRDLGRARGLALPIVVLDDQSLELIAIKQRAMGHPSAAVNSGGTDFAAVARAMGGHGVRVEHPGELAATLHDALCTPPFTVIHCPIPRGSYDGIL